MLLRSGRRTRRPSKKAKFTHGVSHREDAETALQTLIDNSVDQNDPLFSEYIDKILDILENNTDLAGKEFEYIFRDPKVYPLWFLVLIGADLEAIQAVLQMDPCRVRNQKGFLLHQVCAMQSIPAQVIKFLAKHDCGCNINENHEFPAEVFARERLKLEIPLDDGDTFHEDPESIEAFKALVSSNFFDNVLAKDDENDDTLLEIIFRTQRLEAATKEWFFHLCVPHIQQFEISGPFVREGSDALPLSQQHFDLVDIILPNLTHLWCDLQALNTDVSLVHGFLANCAQVEGLKSFELALPPSFWTSTALIDSCLSVVSSPNMTELSLTTSCFEPNERLVHNELVERLISLLTTGKTLESLSLEDFTLTHGDNLRTFLLGEHTPPKVSLNSMKFLQGWSTDSRSRSAVASSQLKHLELDHFDEDVSLSWIPKILKDSSLLFALQALELELPDEPFEMEDISELLASIISKGRLEYLSCKNHKSLNLQPILRALKGNESLERLSLDLNKRQDEDLKDLADLMKEGFTALIYVDCMEGEPGPNNSGANAKKITYYSVLNKYDRKEMRNDSTPNKRFVDIIYRASVTLPAELLSFVQNVFHSSVPLVYGLLRENPGAWSCV